MAEFEEAKSFLMKDNNGTNLYDHISDVLLKVLSEKPEDSVALFEQLSALVKQERYIPGALEGKTEDQDPAGISAIAAKKRELSNLAKFLPKDDNEDNEGVEDAPPLRADVVEDLFAVNASWESCGINFPKSEIYKLLLSLSQLAGSNDSIETLRFWGKVLGRNGDYYIAEGTGVNAQDDEDESAEEIEPQANKYTYWVCSHPGGDWKRLPVVKPSAVLCSQQIKKFLTGDLSAPVSSYPPFPGKEEDYLRSLIARIGADCAIAPKGFFKLDEEEGTVGIDEEYEAGSSEITSAADGWDTYGLKFNSLGRVTAIETTDEDGNEVTEPADWETEYISAVSDEHWTVRSNSKVLESSKSSLSVLRSNLWPGAYAVASTTSSAWSNVYVGFGFQNTESNYTPPMPPQLQSEFGTEALIEQKDVVEDPSPPEGEEEEED